MTNSGQHFHSTAFFLSAMGTGATADRRGKWKNSPKNNTVIHLEKNIEDL